MPGLRDHVSPGPDRAGGDAVPAHQAFSPHCWAFHGTPTRLGLGTMLPYLLDQLVRFGCWNSGSVTMSFHRIESIWLYRLADLAGSRVAIAWLNRLSTCGFA